MTWSMLRKDHFNQGLWSQGGACSLVRHHDNILQPELYVVHGVYECRYCGQFQHIPKLKPGQVAECCRCHGHLERRRRTGEISAPLAFCIASIAIYIALLTNILMTLDVYGRKNPFALIDGPLELSYQGFGEIGLLVAFATIIMPAVILTLMMAILYGASRARLPLWVRPCLTWYERLRPWSMVEVYMLGVLVAYTKLIGMALVFLQSGVFLLAALMLMMAALDSVFDASLVWEHYSLDLNHGLKEYKSQSGAIPRTSHMLSCHACHLVFASKEVFSSTQDMGDCPRCGQILRRRKKNSVEACLSFVLAGIIFYIPANALPVLTYTKVGHGAPSTIIGGVIELWQYGLWGLAILVLFASILVPVFKIISLFSMLYCEKRKISFLLLPLTKIYRIVLFIGRWSMIDVFMISILVAVVRFSFMANVTADPGVVFFALVVILTIFAADMYDVRGMWDAAGKNRDREHAITPSLEKGPQVVIQKNMESENA